MNRRRTARIVAATTAAALTTLSFPGAAMAASGKPKPKPASQAAKDTDRDGMSDTYEKANGLNQRRNDANGDKDADKLTNLAEYKAGTRAAVADTDGDSLPDGYEVAKKLDPKRNDANSDPDADGLANKIERMLGLNPRSADTDGDGVKDADEDADGDGIRNGTDKKPKVYDKPVATKPVVGKDTKATVQSFDAATGALTLAYVKGMTVTVTVTDKTEFSWYGKNKCAQAASAAALTVGRGVHGVDLVGGDDSDDDTAPAPAPAPEETTPAPAPAPEETPAPEAGAESAAGAGAVVEEISLICA